MIGSTHQSRWPARLFAAAALSFVMPLGAQNNAATTSGWNPQQVPHGDYVEAAGRRRANHHGAARRHLVHDAEPDRKWFLRTPGWIAATSKSVWKAAHLFGRRADRHKANRAGR
jgi:hypothetical protein